MKSSYNIPPLNIFTKFIQFLLQSKEDNKIYTYIFILDSLLGIGYLKIIDLCTKTTKDIRLKGKYLEINLNQELFANYHHYLLPKNNKKISYLLPERIVLLIIRLQEESKELTNQEKKLLKNKDRANEYFNYIKNAIKDFSGEIHFDPKHMWRLILSYVKYDDLEDMSNMFCVGRYQQNDKSRLAYTATPSNSIKHSKFIENLYLTFDIHDDLGHLLGLEEKIYEKSIQFNSMEMAGSNQGALKQETREFFEKIKKELKKIKSIESEQYFNLYAIYLRFALSILLGSRTYDESINFNRISFEMSSLIITEKSNTLLSGIRMIPLCDTAKNLIKKYKKLCEFHNLNPNYIYLKREKFEIFKVGDAISISIDENYNSIIKDFVAGIRLNTGRHIIVKEAIMQNFNLNYLEALMGHYIAGGEQLGIYSTLNIPTYINTTKDFLEGLAYEYNI